MLCYNYDTLSWMMLLSFTMTTEIEEIFWYIISATQYIRFVDKNIHISKILPS